MELLYIILDSSINYLDLFSQIFNIFEYPSLSETILPMSVQDGPVSEGLSNWEESIGGALRTNEGGILGFVGELIQWTLGLLGTIFFIITLFAGFKYMTAGGDSQKVSSALGLLKNAIIGVIIIGGSYLITEYVLSAVLGGVSS